MTETPVCNVCLGEPDSEIDCICEGAGTIYGENTGLRRELFKLKKENELLKSQLISELKIILKEKD